MHRGNRDLQKQKNHLKKVVLVVAGTGLEPVTFGL